MKVYTGFSRTAYVGRRFTLKVAKFQPGLCASTLKRETKEYLAKDAAYKYNKFGFKHYLLQIGHIIHGTLLEGTFSNLLELYGSLKFNDIVVPTRFSLLGLFNIMDTAEWIEDFSQEERDAIINCFDHKDIAWIEHTVVTAQNYGMHKGKLKLVDCGNLPTIKAVSVQRDPFRQVLDTIEQMRGLANSQ